MVFGHRMTYCVQRLYIKLGRNIPARAVRRHASKVAQPVLDAKPKGSDKEEPSYFIDWHSCVVKGGKGGDGVISFASTRHKQFAGPDGGNGGSGGHVVFQVSGNVKSLTKVPGQISAADGRNGAKRNFQGKSGQHTFIPVPIGTVFCSEDGELLTCLDEPDDYYHWWTLIVYSNALFVYVFKIVYSIAVYV